MYYLALIIVFILFRLFVAYKINVNISAFIMSLLLTTLCIKFCLSYFNFVFEFDILKQHYTFILLTTIPTFLFCFFMIKLGLQEGEL
jgi:hypothetical protein